MFVWWARHTMKEWDQIISKVKLKYWERTHEYGICVPKTIQEARQIDEDNGDTLWMDAVHQEMQNVRVTYDEHEKKIWWDTRRSRDIWSLTTN